MLAIYFMIFLYFHYLQYLDSKVTVPEIGAFPGPGTGIIQVLGHGETSG